MKAVDKIWMDGKMVDWADAKVHVLNQGLHYGSAVFEGMRCYKTKNGPAVFRLDEHIRRLFYSAGCLGIKIPFALKQLKEATLELIKANKVDECYIRPIVFCGYGKMDLDISGSAINVAIALWPWTPLFGDWKSSISIKISKYRRLSRESVPIDAKASGFYVNSSVALQDAKKHGADEALLLDEDGYVAEGPGENIFIVKNSKIYTPSLGAILPGITRNSIIRIAEDMRISVVEKKITVKELEKADEAFFTGTAVEVCPIGKIDGKYMSKGIAGKYTLMLAKKYGEIVRGEDRKYYKWLNFIK